MFAVAFKGFGLGPFENALQLRWDKRFKNNTTMSSRASEFEVFKCVVSHSMMIAYGPGAISKSFHLKMAIGSLHSRAHLGEVWRWRPCSKSTLLLLRVSFYSARHTPCASQAEVVATVSHIANGCTGTLVHFQHWWSNKQMHASPTTTHGAPIAAILACANLE